MTDPSFEPEAEPSKPVRTFTDSHPCKLTPEQIHTYAIELAGEQGRLRGAQVNKEEATKMHGATIKGHEARCNELAVKVNQGWEYREVEIDELENWENKTIMHVRRDTGQIVYQRPMTEQERQPRLPVA